MSQQNENELWDLIQDSPAEEAPAAPKQTKAPSGSSQKKSPWMFVSCGLGVALIVTVGMLLTRGGSSTPAIPTAPDNSAQVQELQTQVDALTEEKAALLQQIDQLNTTITGQETKMDELLYLYNEMSANLEYVESNAALGNAEAAEKYQRTMDAYALLIKAQNAFLQYDEETLLDCIDRLMDDLELLDQNALAAFYNVMEYMEQPYWRNQN